MRRAQVQAARTWGPTTKVGRRSVALAVASLAGLALSIVGFATGVLEAASGFSDNWPLTVWGFAVLAAGATAAATGIVARARHDRSSAVVLAVFFGLAVLVLSLNEVFQGLS
jgi:hypothetical protein